jgi:hypothetical protein
MTEVRADSRATREDPHLAELRSVVLRALGGPVATVYLFGSFAIGGRHRASDVDLALEAPEPLSRDLLARLREQIEESHVPYRVDVVDLSEADASFRERVKRTGKVWIERASG